MCARTVLTRMRNLVSPLTLSFLLYGLQFAHTLILFTDFFPVDLQFFVQACRENAVGTVSPKLMHKLSVQAPPKVRYDFNG
jgi:hypothetical protein